MIGIDVLMIILMKDVEQSSSGSVSSILCISKKRGNHLKYIFMTLVNVLIVILVNYGEQRECGCARQLGSYVPKGGIPCHSL